ncbi:ABC transporter permease [bacterium]|nr:ABC transporter permease [bacterium]
MRNIFILINRELKTYFYSIMGYVILAMFLLIYGFVFWFLVNAFSNPQNNFNEPITNFFFGTFYYWFILIIVPPLLTMKTIAEERKSGSLELLMTASVTEFQIIISKFAASFIFYVFMWLITIYYFFLLSPHTALDWNMIFVGYLGTFLVGGVFISLGIFSSTISRNQIVAAVISFGLGLLIFSLSFISYFIDFQSVKSVLEYINIMDSTIKFSQGVLDTRPVVYFLSLIIFFNYLSVRILDSQRWR